MISEKWYVFNLKNWRIFNFKEIIKVISLQLIKINEKQKQTIKLWRICISGVTSGKEPPCQGRSKRLGFDPLVWKIPWRRTWQPTPASLPGESHGQRKLGGDSPRGHKESDITEAPCHACTCLYLVTMYMKACIILLLGRRAESKTGLFPLVFFPQENLNGRSYSHRIHNVVLERPWRNFYLPLS